MCGIFFYTEKNKKLDNSILTNIIKLSEKRGLDTSNTGVFSVAGLAEFAMLVSDADKWVQFK